MHCIATPKNHIISLDPCSKITKSGGKKNKYQYSHTVHSAIEAEAEAAASEAIPVARKSASNTINNNKQATWNDDDNYQ